MSMTNFRSEDMPGKIAYAEDSPESDDSSQEQPEQEQTQDPGTEQAQDAAAEEQPAEESATVEEEVPDGTTAEILAWVGDDKDKAQRALDKENAEDKPRVGLTGELNKILSDDGE